MNHKTPIIINVRKASGGKLFIEKSVNYVITNCSVYQEEKANVIMNEPTVVLPNS